MANESPPSVLLPFDGDCVDGMVLVLKLNVEPGELDKLNAVDVAVGVVGVAE